MSRILIVDDEPQCGTQLRDALIGEGHEIRTATNSHDAMQEGAQWEPRLLIADWMLKCRLDGLEVSLALRALHPGLETILISAYASDELRTKANQAEVFRLVEKPFSLREITGAVRDALSDNRRGVRPRLLLVSSSPTILATAQAEFAACEVSCRAARSHDDARRLVANDESICTVIIDCLRPGPDEGLLAAELRELRRDLTIIGSSEYPADAERFSELGVHGFLPRYWSPEELRATLTPNIPQCVECGLPLPLRRAGPDETALSWECSMCGARYRGVVAEGVDDESRRNARPTR